MKNGLIKPNQPRKGRPKTVQVLTQFSLLVDYLSCKEALEDLFKLQISPSTIDCFEDLPQAKFSKVEAINFAT